MTMKLPLLCKPKSKLGLDPCSSKNAYEFHACKIELGMKNILTSTILAKEVLKYYLDNMCSIFMAHIHQFL